jgi:hypothetical protein
MRRARYNVIYILVKTNERAPLRTGSTRTGDTRIESNRMNLSISHGNEKS